MKVIVKYPLENIKESIFENPTTIYYNGDYLEIFYKDEIENLKHAKIYRIKEIIIENN